MTLRRVVVPRAVEIRVVHLRQLDDVASRDPDLGKPQPAVEAVASVADLDFPRICPAPLYVSGAACDDRGEPSTLDAVQSADASPRAPSQFEYAVLVTLSPSGTVNGLAARAQRKLPHERLASADEEVAAATALRTNARNL